MSLIIKEIPKKIRQSLLWGMVLILTTGCLTLWIENRPHPAVKRRNAKTRSFTPNELHHQNAMQIKKPVSSIQKPDSNPLRTRAIVARPELISEGELPLLARIIHAEAGGEPLKGQVAVGAVLLNRIKSGRFPRTLKANIFRPGEFESVANGYIWSNPSASSYKAARLALTGWDPSCGALYFFNPAKTRSNWIWSRPIHTAIGQHNFSG